MKKGVVTDFLPYLILGLVGIIIISAALIIPGLIAAKESGESGICGLQMMMKGLGTKITFGQLKAKDLPDSCRLKNVFIDEKMVEEHLDEAEKAIKKYKKDPQKYKEVLQFFDEDEFSYWEWALDKIIADEIFDCWALKAIFGSLDMSSFLTSEADSCFWCSAIIFDESLRNKITPKKYFITGYPHIGSLGPFMRVEEKGYKFKNKDTLRTYDKWINNNYNFYPLREIPYHLFLMDKRRNPAPWAITYVMTSEYWTGVDVGPGKIQKNWLSFIPAKNLKKELYWFGSTIGDHKACVNIIGV